MRAAPHISQDSRDGWFKKVHRGHWKEASGSEAFGDGFARGSAGGVAKPGMLIWAPPNSETGLGRTGSGVCSVGPPGCLLVTLEMAALRT